MGSPENKVGVRFNKVYLMAVNVCKCALVMGSSLLPQGALTSSLSSVVASSCLFLLTLGWILSSLPSLSAPCSSPLVNCGRVGVFGAAVYAAAVGVVVSLGTAPSLPFPLLLLPGVFGSVLLFLGFYLCWFCWSKGRSGS